MLCVFSVDLYICYACSHEMYSFCKLRTSAIPGFKFTVAPGLARDASESLTVICRKMAGNPHRTRVSTQEWTHHKAAAVCCINTPFASHSMKCRRYNEIDTLCSLRRDPLHRKPLTRDLQYKVSTCPGSRYHARPLKVFCSHRPNSNIMHHKFPLLYLNTSDEPVV